MYEIGDIILGGQRLHNLQTGRATHNWPCIYITPRSFNLLLSYKMNSDSQETLRRMNQNDPSLTRLNLVDINSFYGVNDGEFYSDNSDDYSTLGTAIANNTHLDTLEPLI